MSSPDSPENDQALRDWVDKLMKEREVSVAWVKDILKEYENTKTELAKLRTRTASKQVIMQELCKSHAMITRSMREMEGTIVEDRRALEEEEKQTKQLQIEYDKLEAKYNEAVADPKSNPLIQKELGFEAMIKARDSLDNPDLQSLQSDLEVKEEQKRILEKELLIANKNIRCLKSNLDYYRVSAPEKQAVLKIES